MAMVPTDRAEQVRRIVDQAPPFTEEQRRKLRPILAGGLDAILEAARAEAEKAPPPSPELVARVAPRMGWVPARTAAPPGAAIPPGPLDIVIAPPPEPEPQGAPRSAGPSYLYRYRDACGCLLYVGITDDPKGRDMAHRSTSPWHGLAADRSTEQFETRDDAEEAERLAVLREQPAFNIALRTPTEWNKAMADYLLVHGPQRP